MSDFKFDKDEVYFDINLIVFKWS